MANLEEKVLIQYGIDTTQVKQGADRVVAIQNEMGRKVERASANAGERAGRAYERGFRKTTAIIGSTLSRYFGDFGSKIAESLWLFREVQEARRDMREAKGGVGLAEAAMAGSSIQTAKSVRALKTTIPGLPGVEGATAGAVAGGGAGLLKTGGAIGGIFAAFIALEAAVSGVDYLINAGKIAKQMGLTKKEYTSVQSMKDIFFGLSEFKKSTLQLLSNLKKGFQEGSVTGEEFTKLLGEYNDTKSFAYNVMQSKDTVGQLMALQKAGMTREQFNVLARAEGLPGVAQFIPAEYAKARERTYASQVEGREFMNPKNAEEMRKSLDYFTRKRDKLTPDNKKWWEFNQIIMSINDNLGEMVKKLEEDVKQMELENKSTVDQLVLEKSRLHTLQQEYYESAGAKQGTPEYVAGLQKQLEIEKAKKSVAELTTKNRDSLSRTDWTLQELSQLRQQRGIMVRGRPTPFNAYARTQIMLANQVLQAREFASQARLFGNFNLAQKALNWSDVAEARIGVINPETYMRKNSQNMETMARALGTAFVEQQAALKVILPVAGNVLRGR